jgi:hypothetical protein
MPQDQFLSCSAAVPRAILFGRFIRDAEGRNAF